MGVGVGVSCWTPLYETLLDTLMPQTDTTQFSVLHLGPMEGPPMGTRALRVNIQLNRSDDQMPSKDVNRMYAPLMELLLAYHRTN